MALPWHYHGGKSRLRERPPAALPARSRGRRERAPELLPGPRQRSRGALPSRSRAAPGLAPELAPEPTDSRGARGAGGTVDRSSLHDAREGCRYLPFPKENARGSRRDALVRQFQGITTIHPPPDHLQGKEWGPAPPTAKLEPNVWCSSRADRRDPPCCCRSSGHEGVEFASRSLSSNAHCARARWARTLVVFPEQPNECWALSTRSGLRVLG